MPGAAGMLSGGSQQAGLAAQQQGLAAVGAPPVVQVVVDVLGITLTCLVCTAVLS